MNETETKRLAELVKDVGSPLVALHPIHLACGFTTWIIEHDENDDLSGIVSFSVSKTLNAYAAGTLAYRDYPSLLGDVRREADDAASDAYSDDEADDDENDEPDCPIYRAGLAELEAHNAKAAAGTLAAAP